MSINIEAHLPTPEVGLLQEDEVFVVKVNNDLYEALSKALQKSGRCDNISDNDIIVVKVNLCDLALDAVTSADIVECFIRYFRNRTKAKILIVESDHWLATADKEFNYFDFSSVAKKFDNVELVNLSKTKKVWISVRSYKGVRISRLRVPVLLLKKEIKLFSITKPKTHTHFKLTCIMKNHFGLLPGWKKSPYHPYMNEILFILNDLFSPALCIVDGRWVMEGMGPAYGRMRHFGFLIVGHNPISIDSVVSKLLGFSPRSVPYLNHAINLTGVEANTKIVGDDPERLKIEFIPTLSYLLNRLSYRLQRISQDAADHLRAFSQFLSDASTGYIVLRKGNLVTFRYGLLRRRLILRYAKGLMDRYYTCFLLKLRL
jgi:uncharacterized protein (DUF362 family)